MSKTWRIALHEYELHVFNKRFLLGLLSVPFVILLMIGMIFLLVTMENDTRPIGYVDLSGLLADPLPPPEVEALVKPVEFRAYADEGAAQAALEAGEIGAYYVIPEDYPLTGSLSVVHTEALKDIPRDQFYDFLAVNLLRDYDPAVVERIIDGYELIVQSADGSRTMSGNGWFNIMLPLFAALAFMIAMFTAGGYLMQAVVDEKENRTMEVLLTSVSPNQFMAGKIIGDIATGLTQILAWIGFLILGVLAGRSRLEFLQGIDLSPQTLLLMAVILVPAFVMVCALMAAIGATVSDSREGQQMTGLVSLPIWIPYMLTTVILFNPNAPIVIALSLFPLTAPITMLIRQGMTIIPAWQIAASSAILVLSAVAAIWLAGRAFRLGMLRYGKRLRWREIFAQQTRSATADVPIGEETA
ncbi:MAG: ABC transporter permease [Anaerolineales bacterium]|nr:ABC transporter permease [Anaerolineales bacterium]